jgi:hypothetical protein
MLKFLSGLNQNRLTVITEDTMAPLVNLTNLFVLWMVMHWLIHAALHLTTGSPCCLLRSSGTTPSSYLCMLARTHLGFIDSSLNINRLRSLPSGLLQGLEQLTTLEVSHNLLTSLPDDLLARKPNLFSLSVVFAPVCSAD